LYTVSVNMTYRDQGSVELELPMAQAVQVSRLSVYVSVCLYV